MIPVTSRPTTLDALDDALVGVRRMLRHPAHRRRVLEGIGTDVSIGTLRVARAVERGGEQPPVIGDVAELLGIDPSTASRMVDDAVRRGLVDRQPCTQDRRRQRLRLTEDGAVLLERATAVRRQVLAEITEAWQAEEVAGLVHQLDRLLDDFDALVGGS